MDYRVKDKKVGFIPFKIEIGVDTKDDLDFLCTYFDHEASDPDNPLSGLSYELWLRWGKL